MELEVNGDSESKAWDRGCCAHDVCAGGQDGGRRADRGEQQDDEGIGFGIGLVVYAARPGGKENQGFTSSRPSILKSVRTYGGDFSLPAVCCASPREVGEANPARSFPDERTEAAGARRGDWRLVAGSEGSQG